MQKLITFEEIRDDICAYQGEDQDFVKQTLTYICFHESAPEYGNHCTAANCPVWKKLKVVK